jgi:hypothetical protein
MNVRPSLTKIISATMAPSENIQADRDPSLTVMLTAVTFKIPRGRDPRKLINIPQKNILIK